MQTAYEVREHLYALIPFWQVFGGEMHFKSGTSFESDAGMLLGVLLAAPESRRPKDRALVLRNAALTSRSAFFSRLVFRQIVEESLQFEDDDLGAAILALGLANMTDHVDLLAELVAIVAVRQPISPQLLEILVTNTRFFLDRQGTEMHADYLEQVERACAKARVEVPSWARVPTQLMRPLEAFESPS